GAPGGRAVAGCRCRARAAAFRDSRPGRRLPAMIVCRTLGPPELTLGGAIAPAELTWRKHLALLVYLARSPRGRTREHLAGLLWADRPESSARHSLNVALHAV